mmetsp:Transcript_12230/g.18863  ORF Transcript_12230/g.18863 Transcript_12230/m.18863 type:complete len:198 (-) Transcript_12230:314-907(-)
MTTKMRAAIRTGLLGTTIAFTKDQPHPLPDTAELKPNEILIKVKSAAINPVDYKLPHFIGGKGVGFDVSGVVERVSPTTDFSVGDNVFGRVGISSGSLADYAIVSTDRVAKKPEWISFDEAAAIGVAYLTGVHAFKLGSVKEGSSVLVIGASGGCGLAGIQLAVAMKANVVGICSGKTLTLFRERAALIRWRILIWS